MLATLLDRLGIQGWSLKLNSVGCANDRPIYLQALRDALKDVVHTMCSDCQRRAETNPLRVLDCKVPEDQPIIEKLPRMADYLDESCRAHFAEVQKLLTAMEVPSSSTTVLSADWIITRARPLNSRTARWARKTPFWAADVMTGFPNRSAVRPRPASDLPLAKTVL